MGGTDVISWRVLQMVVLVGCHMRRFACTRRMKHSRSKWSLLNTVQKLMAHRYDRYLNLNTLSRLHSFRWCLGPDCSNGQLYDDEGVMDPRIRCEECGFEMCYSHSIPWHEGQTCEQFDSVREHGDPEFQQTQDWIANNTKPCPSCKENIQKGEYCFHMTCKFPTSPERVAVMLNTENRFKLPL